MNIHNHPFIKISPNDIPRVALPLTVTNPHTRKKAKTYGIIDTGADHLTWSRKFLK
jgi:hypothetical protein